MDRKTASHFKWNGIREMSIIYPRIEYDKKKSVKLKLHDIEVIHHLYHIEKWTMSQIADRFNVVPNAVRYHLDPEYRQKSIDRASAWHSKRRTTDEVYRRNKIKCTIAFNRRRLDEDKEYVEYKNAYARSFHKLPKQRMITKKYLQKNRQSYIVFASNRRKKCKDNHPTYSEPCQLNGHMRCNGKRRDKILHADVECKCPCHN